MLLNYQARSPFVSTPLVKSLLLASERSERDTYRGNTIENRGCLFIYLLASERSERDTYRGNTIQNRGCLFIYSAKRAKRAELTL